MSLFLYAIVRWRTTPFSFAEERALDLTAGRVWESTLPPPPTLHLPDIPFPPRIILHLFLLPPECRVSNCIVAPLLHGCRDSRMIREYIITLPSLYMVVLIPLGNYR